MCIGLTSTPPTNERTCLVTGIGISMQRSDSRFLSHRGLEFYKTFNYKVFQALEARFLSNKWRYSSEKVKVREIAHGIRHKFHNNKRKANPDQLEMFEEGEILLGSVR